MDWDITRAEWMPMSLSAGVAVLGIEARPSKIRRPKHRKTFLVHLSFMIASGFS